MKPGQPTKENFKQHIMRKLLKRIFFILCTVGASWLAIAHSDKLPGIQKSTLADEAFLTLRDENEAIPEQSDDEKKILAELQGVFSLFLTGTEFYLEGTVSLRDPLDSSQDYAPAAFTYYKKDDLIYYKNPEQEMVNTADFYTVVDHLSKRIVVAPSKSFQNTNALPLSVIGKNLKGEGYKMERIENEDVTTIRLLCETHVSCKEIKVEFETTSKKPRKLFYRFTNLDYPELETFDRTLSITIDEWKMKVGNIGITPKVTSLKEGFTAAKGYEGYDIIDLYTK